jgi:predicted nucleic acid-binding protein
MSDNAFLDTNILIYLYSEDETHKREAAYQLVNTNKCITSTQAFNEASNIWLKKYELEKTHIIKYLDELETVCENVNLIQRNTINHALEIKQRYGFSYYDCLMLSSALDRGCDIIYTEDMQDGQFIEDRLAIINPFRNKADEEI